MYRAMETYKAVGFEGPFMMDHTPQLIQKQAGWAGLRCGLHKGADTIGVSVNASIRMGYRRAFYDD